MMAAARSGDGDYCLGFEETELRLGLPGVNRESAKTAGKRGFSEIVDLKLKLTTTSDADDCACVEAAAEKLKMATKQEAFAPAAADPEKPPAPKAQVVGWPPVRSFRKNILSVQSAKPGSNEDGEKSAAAGFVKVSMDGAPYLRKLDLKMHAWELPGAVHGLAEDV